MDTNLNNPISSALFGATRRAVLALLYGQAQESFYLRQIARWVGTGQGAVQRELKRLAGAGIILRQQKGKEVYYQANPQCPIFVELKSLVLKTAGVGELLREALEGLSDKIMAAFIYGSLASGQEQADSDVDLMVIGAASFAEVSKALRSVEEQLSREVNPAVYTAAEFKGKLISGHPFLSRVAKEKKIFLVGDENELGRLA
ncbi:MAG: ArsR family transcriptional regulator [Candidatus Latescibacteria bacterium]|nr:ArsR family transcriptional regulator [Candidatus Latescibacterota bacterium]